MGFYTIWLHMKIIVLQSMYVQWPYRTLVTKKYHPVWPHCWPWGLMQVLPKLPWVWGLHHELTQWYPWGRLEKTQLLVEMIHRWFLQVLYNRCHQQPRRQRQHHWVRLQRRAECHHEFHLATQHCTKIMVLYSWHRTQARIHSSAVIICRDDGL